MIALEGSGPSPIEQAMLAFELEPRLLAIDAGQIDHGDYVALYLFDVLARRPQRRDAISLGRSVAGR